MKKINTRSQLWRTLKYIIGDSKLFAILFLFGLVVSILIAYYFKENLYNDWIDPIASIMTLLVAISIALVGYRKTWIDSLPKKLTVHYTCQNRYHLSCYYADLTSEGDIRTWAQQIGAQMTNNSRLSFNPFFDLSGPDVILLEPNKITVLHYEITILLKDINDLKLDLDEKYIRWYVIHGVNHDNDQVHKLDPIAPQSKWNQLTYTDLKEILEK